MTLLIFIFALTIFVLLIGALAMIVLRYRQQGDTLPADAPTHNWKLQVLWTLALVVVVGIIGATGLKQYAERITAPAHAYDVFVVAQGASWTFEHRNGKVQDDGQLFVPADRPVRLTMTSQDQTYSLSLPAFHLKQNVIPGRETSMWFEAEPGTYQLASGERFPDMYAAVTAFGAGEFEAALDTVAYWLDAYTNDELYRAGPRIFSGLCLECHTLDGSQNVGPSFRETNSLWGQTRTLEDGREVTINEDYIRRSILTPQADIVAGFTEQEMTDFTGQLRDREVVAMIEFIRRLTEVVDEQGDVIVLPDSAAEESAE